MRISRKKQACIALVLCGVAGCSNDTAYSLSRDYRNLNNECIDAMMMVTSEARAKFVTEKVFKTFGNRLEPLNKRAANYEQNTDDKVIVLQMVNTESVALLIAEIKINQRRFKLEQDRITNLRDFLVKTEIEKLKAEGQANPVVTASDKWPNLNNLATGTTQSKFKDHLDKGTDLTKLFEKFPTKGWKNALPKEGWDQMNAAFGETIKKFDKIE